jgi:hypothetical protein
MHDTEAPTMTDAERADKAERQLFEVGIQLVAAQERLRLASETIDGLSMTALIWAGVSNKVAAKADIKHVREAWDTVPGDALPPTSPAGESAPASGSTPAASSATSSVSEVEGSRCAHWTTRGDVRWVAEGVRP